MEGGIPTVIRPSGRGVRLRVPSIDIEGIGTCTVTLEQYRTMTSTTAPDTPAPGCRVVAT